MFASLGMLGLYVLRYAAFLLGYLSNNHAFPKPLSPEEEAHYLRLAAQGDSQAQNILIERNLRLVAHVVKKYAQSGYDSDDLISIGTIGLIKAIHSYNYEKKTKLATYAARCIENEILMVMRSGKKLQGEVSLQDSLGHDAEGNEITLMDILPYETDDILDEIGHNMDVKRLYAAIQSTLTGRERDIVLLRYGLTGRPYTQREIAKNMNISRSYVSRIEKKALEKLAKQFQEGAEPPQ